MHDPPPRAVPAPAPAPALEHREEHFQTCLACLATDVRMCDLEQYNLDKSYTALVGYPCGAEEGMPDTLCYECARKLNKFKAFRTMSRRAYTILRGLLDRYGEISDLNLRDIDRKQSNLVSALTQCDLGHLDIEPVIDKKIYVSLERAGIGVDNNEDVLPIKHENYSTGEHTEAETELNIVKKLEIEFDYQYENGITSNTDYYMSELPAPKQEDVKADVKPMKSNMERSRRTKAGAKKGTVEKEKSIKKSTRKNEGEKALRRKRKADDNDTTTVKKGKRKAPARVRPKYNRKKPGAKQHTKYSKEYYEKMAVVTVMTQEEQLEFFKQAKLKESHLPYRCETCGSHILNPIVYENHMKKHQPSAGDVVCDICKFCYKTKNLLTKHISLTHRTKFECRKCTYVTSIHQRLRLHSITHDDVPYFCDVCETTFDKLKPYTEHVYGKHPASMSCASCGVTVFTVAALKRHRARVHNEPEESSGAIEVPCAQCGVVFRSEEAYKVHRTTYPGHDTEHGLIECGACPEQFKNGFTLRKHMEAHGFKKHWTYKGYGDPLECEQCGEHCNNGRDYFYHFRLAHPGMTRTRYFGQEDPLICELCGKVFQKLFLYQRHMDDHNGLKRNHFKCEYCHKTFADPNYLNVHRSVHTRKNPYQCDICDMTFAVRYPLIAHKRTHTKERPFQCEICEKRFADRSNLSRHMKYVHSDVTHYNCDICGKSFKARTNILAHVKHVHEKIPWPKRDRTRPKRKRAETSNDIEELM